MKKDNISLFIALIFVSISQLYLQVLLTRIFSITQGYHWAFLIVGLALLGNGIGGIYLVFKKVIYKEEGMKYLRLLSIIYPLSIVLTYIAVNLLPFDPFLIPWSKIQFFYFFLNFISFLIPFFFSGLLVSLSLTIFHETHFTLYSMTFIGASIGSISVLFFISILSEFGAMLVSVILGLLASLLLCQRSRYNTLSTILLLTFVYLAIYKPFEISVRLSPYKDLSQLLKIPQTKVLATYRNVNSRVDIVESPVIRYAPGLSYKYNGKLPSGIGITTDGENLKAIITSNHFTDYLPQSILYVLKKNSKVLIVEPVGGLDIVLALNKDIKDITVIFENPIMVDILKKYLLDLSNIRFIVEHPRIYLAQSREMFDVIQFSLEESFYVVASGSYSLRENYKYTVESFKSVYTHLNPDGIVLFTRWLQRPPVEELRLFNIILTGLRELGVKEPEKRIVSFRSLNTMTFIVKNGEFTLEEISKIKRFSESMSFDLTFLYGLKSSETNRFNVLPEDIYFEYFQKLLREEDFSKDYPFRIDPPRDDRPFFFHFFKKDQISIILKNWGRTWQPFGGAGYIIIIGTIFLLIMFSVLIIMLPFILKRGTLPRLHKISKLSIYFFIIGVAYLFVEIPIMQRFILYLGKPIYSFSIILAILLLSSGFGSFYSIRLSKSPITLILGVFILAISISLPFILEFSLRYPFYLRVLLCIIMIGPLGFLMGMPFPIALEKVKKYSVNAIPWCWAINGVASVLSSFLSTVISIYTGFTFVLIVSSILYISAGLILFLSPDKRNKEDIP
ncbi:MAG: hypothetical protein N2380_06370 [bacterium]|nr:hypothetical protein [bacterium]